MEFLRTAERRQDGDAAKVLGGEWEGQFRMDRSTQRSQVNGLKTHNTTRGTEKHTAGAERFGVSSHGWMQLVPSLDKVLQNVVYPIPLPVFTSVGFKSFSKCYFLM